MIDAEKIIIFKKLGSVTEVRDQIDSDEVYHKLQAQPTTTTKKKPTTSTTTRSSCCNCAALAQIQQTLNDLVTSVCQSTTTTTKTSTITTISPTTTKCVGHYWPIGDQMVTDKITGKQATSLGSPKFVPDRNGLANQAILVDDYFSSWQLPEDTYFQGDTSVSMWVKRTYCTLSVTPMSVFGNDYFISV
jgi:hypothetical protein